MLNNSLHLSKSVLNVVASALAGVFGERRLVAPHRQRVYGLGYSSRWLAARCALCRSTLARSARSGTFVVRLLPRRICHSRTHETHRLLRWPRARIQNRLRRFVACGKVVVPFLAFSISLPQGETAVTTDDVYAMVYARFELAVNHDTHH
jgi:hypothetical protein